MSTNEEIALALPTPTFDHVVVNCRDRLDDGAEAYRRLGFTLTPRGYHSLGSINHLAIFGTDYLELIGARPDGERQEITGDQFGLNGLVFGTENSTDVYAALVAAGVQATPPDEFTRPVTLPDGDQAATFRTVHLQPPEGRPGRLYFCHHFTRHLVWRDEWRQHANGAVAVLRAVIASDNPSILAALFARMFGDETVHSAGAGVRLVVGAGAIDVLPHASVAELLGDAAGDAAGRSHYMALLTLRTRNLATTRSALASGNVAVISEADRVIVSASAAMGCPIEFVG